VLTLRGVGHMPMYDDPDLVARTILELTRKTDDDHHWRIDASMINASDIELDGTRGRLVVRRWADEEPRHLVLLAHGYGEHSGRYEHVARALAEAGAAVYAPDHLGHGRSEGEQASIHDLSDVVHDLALVHARARESHSDLPLVLIGHSMGGIIATLFVQTQDVPVNALVLSGPVVGGNPQLIGLLELDPIPEVPIDPAMLSRDPAVGAAYAEDPLVYHGAFRRETLQAFAAAVEQIASGPDFGDLPVLWIHGEEDPLAPLDVTRPVVERLARGEQVQYVVYPGARHEVFNETNRDEVIEVVTTFIDSVLASGLSRRA